TNVAEAEVDYLVKSSVLIMTIVTAITSTVDPASVAKKKLVEPFSICADSSSSGGTNPTTDAHQMSLSADVRMYAEYNVKKKRRLKSVAKRRVELLKVREGEIKSLKV
nr:hypothetical protein [Tanacetum cinerariifolium]